MGFLTPDEIKAKSSLKRKEVEIPRWGGSVLVRELTAEERADYTSRLFATSDGENVLSGQPQVRTWLAWIATINQDGSRFWPTEADVKKLPAQPIHEISDAIMELSMASDEAIREEVGNLDGDLSSG